MQLGGGIVAKNNKKHVTVYKSLSGRVFKTIKEAAVDNYNFKNNKGQYAQKDIIYNVVRGDNLWNIAKQNNINLETLYQYNPYYRNKKILMPGDKIIIGKNLYRNHIILEISELKNSLLTRTIFPQYRMSIMMEIM